MSVDRPVKSSKKLFPAILAAAVVVVGAYMLMTKFPAQSVGEETITPATAPMPYSDAEVENFVERDFPEFYTFNVADGLDSHMEKIRPFLTDEGFKGIHEAFRLSGMFEQQSDARMSFVSPPKVIETGEINGKPFWRVEAPVQIKYIKGSKNRIDSWNASVVVMQADDPQYKFGIRQVIMLFPKTS